MAGVALKPSVSSLPSSRYEATTLYRMPPYSNAPPEKPSIHLVTEKMISSSVGSRIQRPPSLTCQLPDTREKESSSHSIAPHLQIPSSINHSKGSLAEFIAQITCLFWFEKASKLNAILNASSSPSYHIPPLTPESIPTIGFRKWVTTILSTTQVSQNVAILALLFIYRLKKSNPVVRGKRGSEFRLMTIALMIGNKFLDDNTYTNKTWAEVSGISVQEIHIMEVEFLSNVRYNLFVTEEEWDRWHTKLGIFAAYFAKASRLPLDNEAQPTTPTTMQPSPHLTPTTPTSTSHLPVRTPKLPSPSGLPSYVPPRHQIYTPATAPILGHPSLSPRQSSWNVNSTSGLHRKRSWDGPVEEPPSKKMAISTMSGLAPLPSLPPMTAVTGGHIPPLTIPSVPQSEMPMLPSSLPQLPRLNFALAQQHPAGPPYAPQSQSQPHFPQCTRAMATVYPPPVSTWSQRTPPTTTLAPISHTLPNNSTNYPDQSKRQSPSYASTSAAISPALSAYSVHTPTRLSPSFIDRNSPYRPVRQVNTLLYPPPSASMNHVRHLPLDQMHYQPLGKAVTERKTGVLPYSHNSNSGEMWCESQPYLHSSFPQHHHQHHQQQQRQPLYPTQSFH
ncbi:mucin [Histoplasma capsulatum H143]|nr:mucin [Histoplasma capsulatum H143]